MYHTCIAHCTNMNDVCSMALQDGVSVFHLTDLSYLTEYSAYTLFIYDN